MAKKTTTSKTTKKSTAKKTTTKKAATKKTTKKAATKKTTKKAATKKTTKKTTAKKPVRKTARKTTKKPVKKTVKRRTKKTELVDKYPLKKEIPSVFDREEVKLSSTVYNMLLKHTRHSSNGLPIVWLLGEDGKQIVRQAIRVKVKSEGCHEMPSVHSDSLYEAYVALNKEKLVPTGLARTGGQFDGGNTGNWTGGSGTAIYCRIGYMLTVGSGIIGGEVFIPYEEKFKPRNSYEFTSGILKKLSVILTDK